MKKASLSSKLPGASEHLISAALILYFLRMVIPGVNYIFIPFLVLITVLIYYRFIKKQFFTNLREFLKSNLYFLILSGFYVLGIILTGYIVLPALKESLNILVFIVFLSGFIIFARTTGEFEKFADTFILQLAYTVSVLSIFAVIKYFLQSNGFDLSLIHLDKNIQGTSFTTDYNFFTLFFLIGLIALFFSRKKLKKTVFYLSFGIITVNIALTSSRRGIVSLILLLVILLLFGLELKFVLKKFLKRIAIITGILIFISTCFFVYRSLTFENGTSKTLYGIYKDDFKTTSARVAYRYLTAFFSSISFEDFYQKIWEPEYLFGSQRLYKKYRDKNDPENLLCNASFEHGLKFWTINSAQPYENLIKTPFGSGVRITTGHNASIWPLEYLGRKIIFYSGHNYEVNFRYRVIKGSDVPIKVGYIVRSSVNNGNQQVLVHLNVKNIDDEWKQGTFSHTFIKSSCGLPFLLYSQDDSTVVEYCDFNMHDIDSDVQLPEYADEVSSDKNKLDLYLAGYDSSFYKKQLEKYGNNLFWNGDFSKGLSYWISSADSTDHILIKTPWGNGVKVVRGNGDNGYWSLYYFGRPVIYHAGHTYRLKFYYKVHRGNIQPFNVGWWVKEDESGYKHALPVERKILENGWIEASCTYKFKYTHNDLTSFINSLQDYTEVDFACVQLNDLNETDTLPKYADEIIGKSDSDYLTQTKKAGNSGYLMYLYGNRIERLSFGLSIFKSYSMMEKIFGTGFKYMKAYAEKFEEPGYDWPHNPFLSAFLYSGILGGLAFLWFILMVIINYIINIKRSFFFFITFSIVFFFVLFSDNSFLNTPLFTFLCVVPFYAKYLALKEEYPDIASIPVRRILLW